MTEAEQMELTSADKTTSLTEVVLADRYVEVQKVVINDLSADENISLPAALCDERLLEEINSIPDKMGFKIGEVADMLGIKQYVLRYWESEFDVLKPKKAQNNQRHYTRKDVENAYLIRKLLHRDRFSIEGARSAMKELKNFVRSEVKKDRDWTSVNSKFENFQDQVDDLLIQIRRAKELFI